MNDENDKPKNQPEDDWAMTPSDALSSDEMRPENVSEDWGITDPSLKFPPNQPPNQPSSAESSAPKEEKKEDKWVMPEPVFRVSSGISGVPASPQKQPEFDKSAPGTESSTGAAHTNAPVRPQASVPPVPAAASSAPQKSSKMPLIMVGLFIMFSVALIFLVGVYFLFLKTPETAQVVTKNDNASSNSGASSNSNSSLTQPLSTPAELPKEIEYKTPMVLVPAGEFTMGSDTGEDISKPAHKVTLQAFYIDKYEVTNAQYKAFCDATQRLYPPDSLEKDYFRSRPNAPVVGISFADAQAYAMWAGKRLPKEEEWEKAASWDEANGEKREFPWGNDFQSNNAAFGLETVSDVGKFPAGASPFGVMDMAGNVLEWVDAYFQPYPGNRAANSEFGSKYRVLRGGFFKLNDKEMLKTTKRHYLSPDTASNEQVVAPIGFRCAVSADDARLQEFLQKQSK